MISRKNDNIIHETFVYIKRHFFTNKNNLLRAQNRIRNSEGNFILYFNFNFHSKVLNVLFYHSERRACMTPKIFYKCLCSHRHLKKIRHNKIISGVNKGKRNIKEAIEQIVSKTHINDS